MLKASAGICILKDGKLLLIKEAKQKYSGMWSLPSGHIDKDENIFDAAIRETKEETGFDIKLTGLVAIHNLTHRKDGNHYISFFFGAEIIGGELSFNPKEVISVEFVEIERVLKIQENQFRGKHKDVIKKFLTGKVLPLDVIENYKMS